MIFNDQISVTLTEMREHWSLSDVLDACDIMDSCAENMEISRKEAELKRG